MFWLFRSVVRFSPESVRRSFAGILIIDNYLVASIYVKTRYFDYYIIFYRNTCKWHPQTNDWFKMPRFDDYLENRYRLDPASITYINPVASFGTKSPLCPSTFSTIAVFCHSTSHFYTVSSSHLHVSHPQPYLSISPL